MLNFWEKITVFLKKLVRVALLFSAIYQQIVPYCWKRSLIEDIFFEK